MDGKARSISMPEPVRHAIRSPIAYPRNQNCRRNRIKSYSGKLPLGTPGSENEWRDHLDLLQ
jgi:hypothetical protein